MSELQRIEQEPKSPSQEIADILSGIGEEHGFDLETVAEIAAAPFEEALEMAYSYLIQADLNADVLLAAYFDNTQ